METQGPYFLRRADTWLTDDLQPKEFTMTPQQIDLVQRSFLRVMPIQETAAQLFYSRLFELDPSLENLFHGDMNHQGKKLMTAIAFVVNGLDNLPSILPVVQDLGRRHVDYGVETSHYDTVGAALLWTLEQGLGDDFDDNTKQAWTAAYGLLATAMIEAGPRKAA